MYSLPLRQPMLGDQVDWVDPLMQNLVAWWPLSEGAGESAVDSSGHNNGGGWNGTGTHHAVSSRGRVGQFNGNDDYIDAGADSSLRPKHIAVASRIKANDTSTLQDFITNEKGAPLAGYILRLFNNNLSFYISVGNTFYGISVSYTSNNWHFVAGTYDGNTSILYVDGVEQNRTAIAGTIDASDQNLWIGKRAFGSVRPFNGLLSDVRIYKRALTPDQVKQLYLRTSY